MQREPDLVEFDALVRTAYEALPPAFRLMTKNVVIRVEDYPDDETVEVMGLRSRDDLLGLYHGVDLTQKSVLDSHGMPDMVFLYRKPILDLHADGGNTLEHIVTHVLVHEIGHHFGLSDAEMDRLERSVRF